jgi:iron complex outermembrane receptor protein
MKLTESLSLSAAFGILSAEFDSFPDGGGSGVNLGSNRLPGAAERQASMAVSYQLPVAALDANLHVDLSLNYNGDYFTNANNVRTAALGDGGTIDYGFVDSFSLVNLRVAMVDQSDSWTLALWSKNLLDKEYVTGTGRDFLNTYSTGLSNPRTVGLDVSYRF